MKKIFFGLLAFIVVLGLIAGGIYATYDSAVNRENIYPGIYINGVDVSNLSEEEALEKLTVEDTNIGKTLHLEYGEHKFDYPYVNLGYNPDYKAAVKEAMEYGREGTPGQRFSAIQDLKENPLNIETSQGFNPDIAQEVVNHISNIINVEPINAQFSLVDGEVVTTKEQSGISLDKEKTKELILSAVNSEAPIKLPVVTSEPEITESYYSVMKGDIGNFSTNYSSSIQNRKENIKLAASILNGTLIMPGQQISFNELIGDISLATGFLPATVIIDGEYDTGTGGGICQVSTTLYNAAVRADLQIDERKNHSRPVNYVPMGLDAAVASGLLDLKLTNPFDFPVYIVAKADNDNIEFKIIGDTDQKNYEIELVSERTQTLGSQTKNQYSNSLNQGVTQVTQSGNTGYRYASYKIKKVNGEQVSTEPYLGSYYPARDTIVTIGTKPVPVQSPNTDGDGSTVEGGN